MKIQDILFYAVKHILTRSRRSALSILGIVIGVVAVVVILSVSEGFSEDLNQQLSAFGPDIIIVVPVASAEEAIGGGFARPPTIGKLFQEDADDIETIEGVKLVSRTLFERVTLDFRDKKITAYVFASDEELFEQYEDYLEIESGRFYKEGESKVAVFGADAATEFFGKDKVDVGSIVQMDGTNYRVIGVLKRIGTSFVDTDDRAILIPFDDNEEVFKGLFLKDEVGYMNVQTEEGYDADMVKGAIEEKLAANRRKRVGEKDFSVITSDQIMGVVGNILFASQLVLGAVTLIASVVGAIGIANTMFVNVLERTKEIGILKALGAAKEEILILFLAESAIIGLAGGFLGLLLSYAGLKLLADVFGVPVVITAEIIIFVSLFSFGTGIVAGILPAYRASKLSPVEAFRSG